MATTAKPQVLVKNETVLGMDCGAHVDANYFHSCLLFLPVIVLYVMCSTLCAGHGKQGALWALRVQCESFLLPKNYFPNKAV